MTPEEEIKEIFNNLNPKIKPNYKPTEEEKAEMENVELDLLSEDQNDIK